MNKQDAQVERARLQNLLDSYEVGRAENGTDDEPLKREASPDRAANVRARIARLDQVIAQRDDVQG